MIRDALIVLAGVFVGALSGSMGIGGGTAMVPMMVLGFGFSETLAQGTSLAAIVPISAVGAYTHFRRGNVLVRPAIWMGCPTRGVGRTPTHSITLWLLVRVRPAPPPSHLLPRAEML